MKIMLDLDGVVYPFTKTANQTLMEHKGYPNIGEWQHWNYGKEFVTDADWRWLWTEGTRYIFGTLEALPYAPTFMRKIANKHHLMVVTHRPKHVAALTLGWLAHYRVQAAEVHVLDHSIAKSTLAKQCDVAIDDKSEVCADLLVNTRAEVYCPNRPWNSEFAPSGLRAAARFHRYDNLKEVLEWLEL